MQNPFNHENYPSNELKRNTFPCSFQNNLTMKYGYIYPAGIWRTVPGATYKIRPTLGLNFMPTTFPVQTRQKVYVHYFYGRDRNFWKDYKDFVNGQRPDLVKPYIDESVTKARTGKLLDYLGVPTTIVGKYGHLDVIGDIEFSSGESSDVGFFPWFSNKLTTGNLQSVELYSNYSDIVSALNSTNSFEPDNVGISQLHAYSYGDIPLSSISDDASLIEFTFYLDSSTGKTYEGIFNTVYWDNIHKPLPASSNSRKEFVFFYVHDSEGNIFQWIKADYRNQNSFALPVSSIDKVYLNDSYHLSICMPNNVMCNRDLNGTPTNMAPSAAAITGNILRLFSILQYKEVDGVFDIDDTNSPYWRSGATTDLRERIKLNAFLPRFYETVYNLYYRNPQNNPYILDGRPEYNKFIPSKDGGVDSNLYELRRRNWEDDFLTTAVQSPQQGIAPLVGLTDRGATLTLTNDDGTVTRYNVTTTDNGSITGIEANDTNPEPVLTKALIDAVSYGISIEDIRNVNAMQKWLELNLRKGYQYKDIIQARWGISISYNELDLPEFIGGFSKDVQLQAVTQTANVNDDVTGQLGWQGGRLFASGDGREITHYCDEEGYIMCLITVVPVPNYSQLLPKHWIERDLLDSYQPEFNHIGFQPITYKEVCPVQAYQESTENVNVLEQTFGYQRPWYQYFNYTDEVHGQFRTTFKDFLINRVFDVKPELSESFLLVDPEHINDVFNVPDADDDKIIGAIYHNCVAKLPISLYAQARLE